jgi:hypothetical protein
MFSPYKLLLIIPKDLTIETIGFIKLKYFSAKAKNYVM